MRLSSPKVTTWWIAVILGVVGLLGWLLGLANVIQASWIGIVGFVLVLLAAALLAVATALPKI